MASLQTEAKGGNTQQACVPTSTYGTYSTPPTKYRLLEGGEMLRTQLCRRAGTGGGVDPVPAGAAARLDGDCRDVAQMSGFRLNAGDRLTSCDRVSSRDDRTRAESAPSLTSVETSYLFGGRAAA